MTVYIAMSVKKPEYNRRYCTKVGAISEDQARKKFLLRHPTFGGAQVETLDSFVNWARKHLSPSYLADVVVSEMVKEAKHEKSGPWFQKYPSHTSTSKSLTKEKMSKSEIENTRLWLWNKFNDGSVPVKIKSLLRRALIQKISASKLTVFEVTR